MNITIYRLRAEFPIDQIAFDALVALRRDHEEAKKLAEDARRRYRKLLKQLAVPGISETMKGLGLTAPAYSDVQLLSDDNGPKPVLIIFIADHDPSEAKEHRARS